MNLKEIIDSTKDLPEITSPSDVAAYFGVIPFMDIKHIIADGYTGKMPDFKDERISSQCLNCQSFDKVIESKYKSNQTDWHQLRCGSCSAVMGDLPSLVTLSDAKAFVMPFGKHKGLKLGDVSTDYLKWLLVNCDDQKLIKKINMILEDREP